MNYPVCLFGRLAKLTKVWFLYNNKNNMNNILMVMYFVCCLIEHLKRELSGLSL